MIQNSVSLLDTGIRRSSREHCLILSTGFVLVDRITMQTFVLSTNITDSSRIQSRTCSWWARQLLCCRCLFPPMFHPDGSCRRWLTMNQWHIVAICSIRRGGCPSVWNSLPVELHEPTARNAVFGAHWDTSAPSAVEMLCVKLRSIN